MLSTPSKKYHPVNLLHAGSYDGTTDCYTGNEWDTEICTDPDTCNAKDCGYGIRTAGSSTTNVARVPPRGRRHELMLTVNVSSLPCGLNSALCFVEMDADGGKSEYTNNAAGTAYGAGYYNSQCPGDIKFINGEVKCAFRNILNWTASTNNANTGTGYYGTYCNSSRRASFK
ncbi:hypothetical protein FISHEDRAFT_67928 [Fistulina hepatica ATCC 64428]|nr:hypothetical protein FISHEDRAFT_67928 [Fistulina hepatica ATCC 64428]